MIKVKEKDASISSTLQLQTTGRNFEFFVAERNKGGLLVPRAVELVHQRALSLRREHTVINKT
jgi:hypothetical protein